MKVYSGISHCDNTVDALNEAMKTWPQNLRPNIVFVFHANRYTSPQLASKLATHFPDALLAGASTLGVWHNHSHQTDALQLVAIDGDDIRWSVTVAESLQQFDSTQAIAVADALAQPIVHNRAQLSPRHHFCLSLFDGLCQKEELVVSSIASLLNGIPLIGGSASDALKFQSTPVIANGRSYHDAAVFILAESDIPFSVHQHHHIQPSDVTTVITSANEPKRLVHTLDGFPAAQRYAEILHLDPSELTAELFSCHPLVYSVGSNSYVRSVSYVTPDQSLQMYTAIEEGMVLNVGKSTNMLQSFGNAMAQMPQSDLLLMCNCVLRALESDMHQQTAPLARLSAQKSQHVVGFDTFGEQYNAQHINQTVVMLSIGGENR